MTIAVGFQSFSRCPTVSESVFQPGVVIADQISGMAIAMPAAPQTP